GDRRWLWLLPLAALAWINLHGSFVIIFVLVGAAVVAGGGDRRAMLATLAAMAVSSCLNPRGPAEWPAAFSTIANASNQQFSLEWQPPVNAGWQMALFFGWLMLFAPLAALSPARLSRLHWLWFLGFGWLALSGLRYVIWFLALLPVLSANVLAPKAGRILDRPRARSLPVLDRVLTVLLLVSPLALLPGLRERWWTDAPPALSATTPVAATRWLKGHPEIPGPLWSDPAYASYLTYALPERPVWIDTRFYPFPPEQWQRYLDVAEAAPGWEDLLAQDSVALLMIHVAGQPRLLAGVEQSPNWCERYRDAETAIFARKAAGQPCAPQPFTAQPLYRSSRRSSDIRSCQAG
ncbi:MAG TPA: hypothetical protein VJ754_07455, partial [Anaerolineae bacterium]|nr:hypothetical protein [Anaerolineae bacterium]